MINDHLWESLSHTKMDDHEPVNSRTSVFLETGKP